MFKKILIWGSVGLFVILFIIDFARGQELPATSTPEIITIPIKTDQEIIIEQKEKIDNINLLLSKYAQKLDFFNNNCN